MSLLIEEWGDVQCSWCYIGSRRLQDALDKFEGQVTLRHRSFELNPEAPEDFDAATFMGEQHGYSDRQVRQAQEAIAQVGQTEGLRYDFGALKPTNSALAHQLLVLAERSGRRDQMLERLYRAYFSEGRHLGKLEELVDLVADVGLDGEAVRRDLLDGSALAHVRAERETAAALGVTSAPFYVINGQYGIAGAQPVDVLLAALREVSGLTPARTAEGV